MGHLRRPVGRTEAIVSPFPKRCGPFHLKCGRPSISWRDVQLATGHTDGFLAAMTFYARFHRYSWSNALLILAQCPQASQVAGMRAWNDQGYTIRKGEKALWVWAPITRKEVDAATGEDQRVIVGFRPAPVWDANQLAEIADRLLPTLVNPLPDNADALYRRIKARIESEGIVVIEEALPAGIYGASQGAHIRVRTGLDSRNRLFVLVHELVHEIAHQGAGQATGSVVDQEFEAEATNFVVAAVLGLENQSSRDYFLTSSGTAQTLRASLGAIQGLVRRVLAIITPSIPEEEIRLAA